MQGQYNMRNPAVKRLMKEAQELSEPTEQYYAQPLEDNLFEWHFTIRGPADSEFDGGIYHGRIILPPEYPMKPPSIILLTPNGRFEIFKKICLSISGHHPESWQPSWSIRTALLAIIGFMPTHGNGAIGSLDYTPEERKALAKKSREFKCTECGIVKDILKPVTEASKAETQEAKELAAQINFQGENKSSGKEDKKENTDTLKSEGNAPITTKESSPTTSPISSTHQIPPAGFNPMMFGSTVPFPAGFPLPPFMRPPTTNSATTTTSSMPFPMPSGGFMAPPFWPPMVPGVRHPSDGQSHQQQQFGNFPWPQSVMFPSPATVASAQEAVRKHEKTTVSGQTPSVPVSAKTSRSTSSPHTPPTSTSSAITTSASTMHSGTVTSLSEMPSTSRTASLSVPTSENSKAAVDTATTSSTNSTSSSTSTTTRQRNVGQTSPARSNTQTLRANTEQNVRQSENPFVILLIVALGVAILALLVRRIYMMNTWRFDNDF